MDPVEIELRMKQNLDTESKKAKKAIETLGGAAEKSQDDIKENIAIQKKVITQLRQELKPLAEAFKKVNVGTQDPKILAERKKLSSIIRKMTGELKAEEKALTQLEARTQTTGKKMTSLRTQMMNVRDAMGALKLAGKENSAEYRKLEGQLGTLGTAYRELRTLEQAASTGGTQLAGFMDGLNALSGTITAGVGIVGIFNNDTEKMAEIQTRLQSIMAISIGLMQVANALHSTSAFRITTVTTVKKLWAAANIKVAATLGITNMQAKALMATLSLGLSVAIGAAIYLLDKFVSKQQKAAKQAKEFSDKVSEGAADQLAAYEKLRKGYQALNGDIDKQKKYIKDNAKEFESLNVAISDVNEQERFFSNEGSVAFKAGVVERAKSLALMEIAAEKYKSIVAKELKYDKMSDTKTVYQSQGQWGQTQSFEVKNDAKTDLKAEIDAANKEVEDIIARSAKHQADSVKAFTTVGVDNTQTPLEGTKAFWEKQKSDAADVLSKMRDAEKGTKQWNAQLVKYREAEDKLKAWSFGKKNSSKDKNKQAQTGEKLRKINIGLQEEVDAAVVAAMQDGAAKKLEALKADYEKRKNTIAEKLHEIEELEKVTGKPATKQRNNISTLNNAVDKQYANDKSVIEKAVADETQKVWDEVNIRFRSDLNNRLADAQKFYDNQLRLLKENIAKQSVLKEAVAALEKQRQMELNQIKAEAAIRDLDFETEIAVRRAAIADNEIELETVKQANILKIQIDYAKKRLAKLKELQTSGGDVSGDIEQTTVALAEMNGQLAGLKTAKMQELGALAQQALSGIAEFVGVFDETAGQGLALTAQTIGGVTNLTAGIMSGDPQQMVAGLTDILNVVGKIIKANKQANIDIQAFGYDIAKQAIDYSIKVIKAIKDIKGEYDSIFIDDSQNALVQGMAGYNAAIKEQNNLMKTLADTTVKTGVEKRKFLGITVGTKDVYSNLLKAYPKLIGATGELDRELADTLLASGDLSKEAKDALEQIIASGDAANAAMQEVDSQLSNLIGTIGSDLKNALDDAFQSGTDAAKEMTNNIAGLMEKMLSEIAFNAVFGQMLKDLEKEAKASFADGGDQDLTDDLSAFLSEYTQSEQQYYDALEQIRQQVKDETGVDPYAEEDNRSGFTKGIAQASQDSIDELNGRVMAISGNVYNIKEGNDRLLEIEKEGMLIQQTISSQLDAIADNTAYCRYLEDIDTSLEDIKTKGVKLR